MAENLKLAFIVPTIGRYQNLKILFDSVERQTLKPNLIVVVDSNIQHSKDNLGSYTFPLNYIHTGPNSLTEARNIGIKNIPRDFNLIGFFDDDQTLDKDAIEKMISFWKNAPSDIGGVAFNKITNRKTRRLWFLKRIFFMGDRTPGNILHSGYQTLLENIKNDAYTKWSTGGASVYRREIYDKFQFDENLKAYGYIEDVDFSYRVSKEYKLVTLAKARVMHEAHPVRKGRENIDFGICEIVNRFYFISKHKEFSKTLFYWASFGKLMENIIFGICIFNSDYFKRALGNILGIKKTLFHNGRKDIFEV